MESENKELELIKKRLNNILHPNGGGPAEPTINDLLIYAECDLRKATELLDQVVTEVGRTITPTLRMRIDGFLNIRTGRVG